MRAISSNSPATSAQPHRALEGEVDEPSDEIGVAHPALLPEGREHGDLGEARHGVDLVDVDLVAGDEEVGADESLGVDRGEGALREFTEPLGEFGRDVGWGVEGRAPITRAGAREGDVVAVCGRLGWSGSGLVVLQRGFGSPKDLVSEHLTPTVPYRQGVAASDLGATAMLDVSDGLLADLGHISERSGVGIDVDTSLVEIPDALARVAAATGKNALSLVLTGGEDHALAATFPATAALPEGWRRIGSVTAGEGVTVDGRPWDGAAGWDHFG